VLTFNLKAIGHWVLTGPLVGIAIHLNQTIEADPHVAEQASRFAL
jgi:hypothetical protein